MKTLALNIIIAIVVILTVPAGAQVTYSFKTATNSDIINTKTGTSQLFSDADMGHSEIAFQFTTITGSSADSESLVQPISANPSESADTTLNLKPRGTSDDMLSELADESALTGINVQGFANAGDESFINASTAQNVVPAPAAVLLASFGMICAGWFRRRGCF